MPCGRHRATGPARSFQVVQREEPKIGRVYSVSQAGHIASAEGPSASKPEGALNLTGRSAAPPGMLVSPVFHGDPDAVAAAILADPGISAADELVLFLPPAFGLAENVRVLTDMANTFGPALGWEPSA